MDEIDKCLKKVRLTSCRKKKVSSYSKGMLQRLAIAQSLLGSPSIIILDEPCAGLDAVGRIEMLALIKELKEEGRTIVLNSHIINDVDRVADRVLIMKDGIKLKEINVKGLSDSEKRESLEEKFIKVIGGLEYVGNN
jgi:ABC-2 type transport system ATP-binding protein